MLKTETHIDRPTNIKVGLYTPPPKSPPTPKHTPTHTHTLHTLKQFNTLTKIPWCKLGVCVGGKGVGGSMILQFDPTIIQYFRIRIQNNFAPWGGGATLVFILIDYESSNKIAFISNMMHLRQILA